MALGAYYAQRRAAGGLTDSAFRMQGGGGLFGSTDANLFNPGNTSSGSTAGVDYSPGGMPAGGYNNETNPNFGNFDPSYIPGNTPAGGTGFPITWQTPGQAQADATAQAFLASIGAPAPMAPFTTAAGNVSDWSANPFYAANPAYGMTPSYMAPAAAPAAAAPAAPATNPYAPKPTAIPGGARSAGDWAIDPTTLSGWSVEQNRQLSPREQRIEALGGQTSWHGTTTGLDANYLANARKSLMELGWNPSMGYGAQNWAALGVTNPNVAAQLNKTLYGISPMSQGEKNWTPAVWRSPRQIANARDAYSKTASLYNSPGPAQALAKRLEQKGYGWLGGARPQPQQWTPPPQTPIAPPQVILPSSNLQAADRALPHPTMRRGGLVG